MFYTLFIYWTIATAEAFAISDNSINTLEDLTDTGPKEYIKGSKYVLIAEEVFVSSLINLSLSLTMPGDDKYSLSSQGFSSMSLYSVNVGQILAKRRINLINRVVSFGRRTERLVLALSVYVGLAWASTQICFFTLTCKPFSGNWAVPPPNGMKCFVHIWNIADQTRPVHFLETLRNLPGCLQHLYRCFHAHGTSAFVPSITIFLEEKGIPLHCIWIGFGGRKCDENFCPMPKMGSSSPNRLHLQLSTN